MGTAGIPKGAPRSRAAENALLHRAFAALSTVFWLCPSPLLELRSTRMVFLPGRTIRWVSHGTAKAAVASGQHSCPPPPSFDGLPHSLGGLKPPQLSSYGKPRLVWRAFRTQVNSWSQVHILCIYASVGDLSGRVSGVTGVNYFLYVRGPNRRPRRGPQAGPRPRPSPSHCPSGTPQTRGRAPNPSTAIGWHRHARLPPFPSQQPRHWLAPAPSSPCSAATALSVGATTCPLAGGDPRRRPRLQWSSFVGRFSLPQFPVGCCRSAPLARHGFPPGRVGGRRACTSHRLCHFDAGVPVFGRVYAGAPRSFGCWPVGRPGAVVQARRVGVALLGAGAAHGDP